MSGGLINIISYGASDLYLTGAPEITFFKVVYRRYTNFSKESVEISLGAIDFGKTVEIEIPKVGDLISNSVLQIDIPAINILKIDTVSDITNAELEVLDTPFPIPKKTYFDSDNNEIEMDFVSDYEIVKNYMTVNMAGYRKALKDSTIKNQTVIQYINSILDTINAASTSKPEIIQKYQDTLTNAYNYEVYNKRYTIAAELNYKFSDITYILNTIQDSIVNSGLVAYGFVNPESITVENILLVIEKAVNNCQIIVNYYFQNVKNIAEQERDANSKYAKFAWVERLGLAMIDYIEVKIGGDLIDKHYGDWINLWLELSGSGDQRKLLEKMLGNVEELISFDRNKKPKYSLYIPLLFWFSKYAGTAFPLIALQFNKFYVSLKLKELEDCAYIEKLPIIDQNGNSIDFSDNSLALTDIWNNLNLSLSGNLLIDYIYLESQERKRFAQSAHEYLIETVELTCINNVSDNKQILELNFTGPSKELIFVCQKNAYVDNFTTNTNKSNLKSLWFNYSTDIYTNNMKKNVNPIYNAKLEFNGYERFTANDSAILNYLNPLSHHTSTPSNGVNVFSFSLFPEEHQPSGTCNFTRIMYPLLSFQIINDMFKYRISDIDPNIKPLSEEDIELETEINIRIYSIRYNILRVMHGFAAKAYH
jgi:hypothetical protein